VGQQQHGTGALNTLLCVTDTVFERSPLVNQRGDQFGGVDSKAAHFGKVGDTPSERVPGQCIEIINQAHRHDGIGAQVGTDDERLARCQKVVRAIEKEKGLIEAVVPNIGAETPKLLEMKNRVVIAVTDTGGVAYDAAFQINPRVITGTVARTYKQKGMEPAQSAARRALSLMQESDRGIALIAASRNSLEDILAAQFIANLLMQKKI